MFVNRLRNISFSGSAVPRVATGETQQKGAGLSLVLLLRLCRPPMGPVCGPVSVAVAPSDTARRWRASAGTPEPGFMGELLLFGGSGGLSFEPNERFAFTHDIFLDFSPYKAQTRVVKKPRPGRPGRVVSQ